MKTPDPREQKIANLDAMIDRQGSLTDEEYLALLQEIRKNYTARLAQISLTTSNSGTGACINIIEKVHWLIDSVETKGIEKPDGDDWTVNVFFKGEEN